MIMLVDEHAVNFIDYRAGELPPAPSASHFILIAE